MRPRPLLALMVIGALCTFMPVAGAASPAASAPPEPKAVHEWLMRIQEAASRLNFLGTFVVSAAGAVSSARIAHFSRDTDQFERIDSLDGQTRHVFRHNELVHTLWPHARIALIEQREHMKSFPALLQDGDDRISQHYEVHAAGMDRVAGHAADVLLVRPRDPYRFGYRLWSERTTGLLLRADVVDGKGELLETSAFSDVAIDVPPQPHAVLEPMRRLEGYRIVRPSLTPARLEDEGWALRQLVPGFQPVSTVKRPLDGLGGDDPPGAASAQALQTIFSDGLTYVSVFIEPFNGERHTRPMIRKMGATHTLMRRQGEWWITVVGDVPVATLKAFAGGLERRR
jgi:sigma-E factor negative regulatory protein RseB